MTDKKKHTCEFPNCDFTSDSEIGVSIHESKAHKDACKDFREIKSQERGNDIGNKKENNKQQLEGNTGKGKKVKVRALENTFLSSGEFIGKGQEVLVSENYANLLKAEHRIRFEIN